MAGSVELRSISTVSYHRARGLCISRPEADQNQARVRDSPRADEIERALSVFHDPNRIYHETAAANIRDAIAEDRQALGLAPTRKRR